VVDKPIRLEIICNECDMEYIIIYDDENYIKPSFCAACGKSGCLTEL